MGAQSFGDAGTNVVEATSKVSEKAMPSVMDDRIYDAGKVGIRSELEDYLGRPIVLSSGVLSSTDTQTTFAHLDPYYDGLNTLFYKNKLVGKYLIRATCVLRLQVNANRFQAGRYILAWLPNGGIGSGDQGRAWWNWLHRFTLTQTTQLPHVELDISTDSQVELRIPYVSGYSGYAINNLGASKQGTVGDVFITPYSPIVSVAGSTTAAYTLWVSFEDVKLEGVAIPQMGTMDPIRKEQENAGVGPVTSTLKKVSRSFGKLSAIPLLSEVAKPVAWVSDILSDAAHVWGWSRPSDIGPVTRTQRYYQGYNANCDVVDSSMPLSLMARNHVETPRGFAGSDLDEMAIDYIKAIPAWIATVDWTTANASGTDLYTTNVCPTSYYTTSTEDADTLYNFTPVAFLAEQFDLWRGNLVFTIKIVKTEFHTGRLMVVFNPYPPNQTGPANNITTSVYALREIIDIREKSEIKFSVPYVCNTPWCNTSNVGFNYHRTGTFEVTVLDALVCPATVSSTVKLLIEVAGGEDFEVAVPTSNNNMKPTIVYEYQSGLDELTSDHAILNERIGGSQVMSDLTAPCSVSIGEKVRSIRALLKRYEVSDWVTTSAVNATVCIKPFICNARYLWSAGNSADVAHADSMTLWSLCYALSRGGMRIRVVPTTIPTVPAAAILKRNVGDDDVLVKTLALTTDNIVQDSIQAPLQRYDWGINGVEFQVPQYSKMHSRIMAGNVGQTRPNWSSGSVPYGTASGVRVDVTTGDAGVVYIQRAAADDFSLGCFVSVPPCRWVQRSHLGTS